ncbi:MAG TPA: hypothetical protein PKI94_00675 [Candidatus Gastranaerophilaceae bacterium]|nr:hypothetical protein [Candidatus Gastranaerophilaceae bacterium]
MDFTFRFSPESSKGQEAWSNFFLSSDSEETQAAGAIALLDVNDCQGDTFCSKDAFGTTDFSNIGEFVCSADNTSVEGLGSIAFTGFDSGIDCASSAGSFDCASSDCGASSSSFIG